MTPAERRTLVERPFYIRNLGHSYPWAGVLIGDTVPTSGRRVWKVTPEDEEQFAKLEKEDAAG